MITFDPDTLQERLTELERELSAPGFWDDQQHAAAVSAEQSRVAKRLKRYERATSVATAQRGIHRSGSRPLSRSSARACSDFASARPIPSRIHGALVNWMSR